MKVNQTPDPKFVKQLEWELESTMRRQRSLNGTSGAMRLLRPRVGTTIALVVASMLVGGAGTHAMTHRVDKQAAALYVARAEALLEIARVQFDHLSQELAQMQARVQQGLVSERDARHMEAQFVQVESEVSARELELAETTATGKEPNDALSAPLVDGRDFVTERLAVRRRPIQMRLDLMHEELQHHQQLADGGLESAADLKGFGAAVAGDEAELENLDRRIGLRASFLSGELSATDVELKDMRFGAVADRERALRQLDILSEQRKRIAMLHQRGEVTDSELRGYDTQMRTVEAQVELAELELRIIDRKLESASDE